MPSGMGGRQGFMRGDEPVAKRLVFVDGPLQRLIPGATVARSHQVVDGTDPPFIQTVETVDVARIRVKEQIRRQRRVVGVTCGRPAMSQHSRKSEYCVRPIRRKFLP